MKYSTAILTVSIITDNNGWASCMHALSECLSVQDAIEYFIASSIPV